MALKLLRYSILIDFPNGIKERNMMEEPKFLEQVKQKIRLKHYSISTTMIYTHVLNKGGKGVRSPLDRRR